MVSLKIFDMKIFGSAKEIKEKFQTVTVQRIFV